MKKNNPSGETKIKSTPAVKAPVKPFPIAGIGASAGGIEAFSRLLKQLDPNLGMAYVLVMHLSPNHKSALAEIMQPKTKMAVHTVKNGMKVVPNNVYVIPPNTFMSLVDGHLKLAPRSITSIGNFAIDFFLDALATTYKNNAIGVILSGTATDGTLGLKAIKAHGGITFTQDGSAKFSGMPRSAYDSGYADFILSPEEIAKEFAELVKIPYAVLAADKIDAVRQKELKQHTEELKKILTIVNKKYGVDFFHQYKLATIYRRVVRRMILNKFDKMPGYCSLLETNPKEVDALYSDFLINVTNFFRDPDFYKTLSEIVLPAIVSQRKTTDPIRIWVAGCSTGEEAYSIAISTIEFCAGKNFDVPISIFASDLDAKAIEKARLGIYPLMSLRGVPPSYLNKYFKKIDGHFQIERRVREMCIFSQQNLLIDPPFSRMDLISCQNVLIYMETDPQKKILATFHYALKAKGYLFLGKSETIGSGTDLFESLDKKIRIFSRKATSSPPMQFTTNLPGLISPREMRVEPYAVDIEKDMGKLLLSQFVPPSVVLNHNLHIVQFYGITSRYLNPGVGKASLNVLKMIREDLLIYLRTLLQQAHKTGRAVLKDGIRIFDKKISHEISIEVVPRKTATDLFYLVVFQEKGARPLAKEKGKKSGRTNPKEQTILKLEEELVESRELIRSTNEEYETTYEELQANSEEVLSANEELQSVNEELETSKEELQSTNEELTTINDELGKRNLELRESHTYADAIIQTMHSPLLVLTANLQVRMANHAFYKTFKLTRENTETRFIYELGDNAWDIPLLRDELNTLLNKKIHFKEFELVHTFPGVGELVLDVHAYRLLKNEIFKETLILLAFNSVGDLVKSNKELKKANEHLEQFAYIASHDLQEPLRKILTFSNYISGPEAALNEFAKKYAEKINASATRMSGLLRDLLSYSLLLKGNEGLKVKVDLNIVLQNIVRDFELVIQNSNASINFSLLPAIMAEPLQINQLFYNLIGNALKFNKKDPVINISSRYLTNNDLSEFPELKKGRDYVAIIVNDNGIGFDQKFADKLFTLFQRLNDKKGVEGTGIGLAICKKIVEDHGGIIVAQGIENIGATFTVILPL